MRVWPFNESSCNLGSNYVYFGVLQTIIYTYVCSHARGRYADIQTVDIYDSNINKYQNCCRVGRPIS